MHRITREVALWCAIGLIGGLFRLIRLDFLLTNAEAEHALTALAVLRGDAVTFPNPLFGWTQALLFTLFGASEVAARIVPALSGAGLCVLPVLLRGELGRTRALWLGGLLALSPTLWFTSRETGGAMLAWALAFAAYCAWRARRSPAAGAAFGALLACGSDAIVPLIVMLAGILTVEPLDRQRLDRRFLVAFGATFALAATGLLTRPSGLGDAFNGYALWFQILRGDPSLAVQSLTVQRLIFGFVVAEPVIIVGAIFTLVWLRQSRALVRPEVAWPAWIIGGGVMLAVVTGRTAAALVPVVIGFAGLASWVYDRFASALFRGARWGREGAIAGIAGVLLIYAALGIWQYAGQGRGAWLMSVPIALLLIAALVAVASLGMDYAAPLRGVALAGMGAMWVYTLSVGLQMNHVRPHNPAEPYRNDVAAEGLTVLQETIHLISRRATGEPDALAVQILDPAPPALRWMLRDQRQLNGQLNASATTGAMITPEQARPTAGNFIGMVFDATARASLHHIGCAALPQGGLDCRTLVRWLAFRDAGDAQTERWLFWVRDDVASKASGVR